MSGKALGLSLFVWLQWADLMTTKIGLACGASEGNPLIADYLHTPWPWLGKLALMPFLLWVLFYGLRRPSLDWFGWAMVAIMAVVVSWNLLIVLGQVA